MSLDCAFASQIVLAFNEMVVNESNGGKLISEKVSSKVNYCIAKNCSINTICKLQSHEHLTDGCTI